MRYTDPKAASEKTRREKGVSWKEHTSQVQVAAFGSNPSLQMRLRAQAEAQSVGATVNFF